MIGDRDGHVAHVYYPAGYIALTIFLVVAWILTLVEKCADIKGDKEKE